MFKHIWTGRVCPVRILNAFMCKQFRHTIKLFLNYILFNSVLALCLVPSVIPEFGLCSVHAPHWLE